MRPLPGWEARQVAIFKARAGGRVRGRGVLTLPQSVEQIFAPNNEFTDRHKKIEVLTMMVGVGNGGRRYFIPCKQGPVIFHQ